MGSFRFDGLLKVIEGVHYIKCDQIDGPSTSKDIWIVGSLPSLVIDRVGHSVKFQCHPPNHATSLL